MSAEAALVPPKSTGQGHAEAPNSPSGSGGPAKKHIRDCACGKGLSCVGMTQAFRLLGDPRCHYVELPRYRKNPPAYKYVFRNNLREAYVRHLAKANPKLDATDFETNPKRRYVALHHFHPTVVRAFYENPLTSAQKHKVPISITEHEAQELGVEFDEEDRILSMTGKPTGGFYFVPSYPQEKAHNDLKDLIHAERKLKEMASNNAKMRAADAKKKQRDRQVPKNISISAEQEEAPFSPLSTKRGVEETMTTTADSDDFAGESRQEEKVDVEEEMEKEQLAATGKDEDNRVGLATLPPPLPLDSAAPTAEQDPVQHTAEIVAEASSEQPEMPVPREKITREMSDLPASADDGGGFEDIWNDDNNDAAAEKNDAKIVASSAPILEPELKDEAESDVIADRHEITESSQTGEPAIVEEPDEADQLKELAAEEFGVDPSSASSAPVAITPKAPPSSSPDKARPWHSATPSGMDVIDESENDDLDLGAKKEKRKSNYFGSVSKDEDEEDVPLSAKAPRELERPPSPILSNEGAMYICNHQPPGTDPSLRIQVHSDLIAWESKRRSNLSARLDFNREEWKTALDIINDGVEEVECAERLVAGFAKAGRIFAEALQAMYDDRFLDNQGNTVQSAFAQNRLMNQRVGVENELRVTRESTLLNSIIESQLLLANQFNENSEHIEGELITEALDLREEITAKATELSSLGESILLEMKQSEMELKKIWDVFDAMVTGDMMEYSVHGGSTHGSMHGSQSGGSMHGFSSGGGSTQGFITPGEGGAMPIVSSVYSPLVKSTFKQLGGVEDGWLIEMYYRAAASYQRSVFEAGEKQLQKLQEDIVNLEERRNRRLHQIMLAFIPRQRRLFLGLPEQLKEMLDSLVGFRVDEESLNSLIDESIAERSKNRLKSSTQHRSSIMNRSKAQAISNQAATPEVESIEEGFGDPFESPQMIHCSIVEIKPFGFGSVMNNSWKVVLAVVTSHGSLLLFEVPGAESYKDISTTDAFQKLYPNFDLSEQDSWVQGRKFELLKGLTPYFSLDLKKSHASVMKMRKLQCEIVEDSPAGSGNRFLGGSSQRRCTIRLGEASETSEFVSKLMAMKKQVLDTKQSSGRKMGFFRA